MGPTSEGAGLGKGPPVGRLGSEKRARGEIVGERVASVGTCQDSCFLSSAS